MKQLIVIISLLILASCDKDYSKQEQSLQTKKDSLEQVQSKLYKLVEEAGVLDSLINSTGHKAIKRLELYNAKDLDSFVNLESISDHFVFDIRYAGSNNFLKQPVYDCDECYVRLKTARALLRANNEFMVKGYRIKFFDCYRPHSVQFKMWEIFPNPSYLSNPKKGSIHNKGGAVDITLVDNDGNELDMGTDFDHFGKEAHHAFEGFSEEIIANRKLLRSIMEKHGFWTIRTEWWHYNHWGTSKNAIEDFTWDCD